MQRHLSLFVLLLASLQAFANFTPTPYKGEGEFQFHWSLPTTLVTPQSYGRELLNGNSPNEMPASIMCQNQWGKGKNMKVDGASVIDKPERYWTAKRDFTLASLPYLTLGIAFHAKPRVVANAEQSINTIGLDGVLYFLGFKDSYLGDQGVM